MSVIPQQDEIVAEVVAATSGPGHWTGREMVSKRGRLWHLMENPSDRTATYRTKCGQIIEGRDALTAIEGTVTCRRCAS